MSFGLKTKHSLSNKFAIEAWNPLNVNEIVAFRLNNGNEIYFKASEIQKKFSLIQKIKDTREEIKNIIINNLNREMKFNDVKIEKYISDDLNLSGGYLLTKFSDEAYIKDIDNSIAEIFFDSIADNVDEKNDLSSVICNLDLVVGTCQLQVATIEIDDVYKFKPKFKAIVDDKNLFDFTLGLNEIMVFKEGNQMNIEDEIGEQVISDDEIKLDINISLGTLEISITQMQDLLVGDFIDINHLSFPKVELKYRNKKIAIAELVYNEKKELSIEIKEVLIK